MAKLQPLKLADMKPSVEHPMANRLSDGRCLMHVKMTDLCMKSVEGLINSEKGAYFSLWFDGAGGGTMVLPTSGGNQREFKFKTAPLREAEGHGSLECIHQNVEQPQQLQLTCLGAIGHRLTVKAMDDVYDRTKKLMREAEEKSKKARAQEIKIPSKGGRSSKAKTILSNASNSSAPRKPISRPANPPRPPSNPFASKATPPRPPVASTRSPRTLRERIVHLLALKPQKRGDLVTRLKKDTKRSESAMSNLDSILLEVTDVNHGLHSLKSSCFSELQVEDWPFYSEQDRQLLRRHLSSSKSSSPTSFLDSLPVKRPSSNNKHADTPPKKPKLSTVPSSSYQLSTSIDPTARVRSVPAHPLRVSQRTPPPSSIPAAPPPSTSATFSPITSISQAQHGSSLTPPVSGQLTTSGTHKTNSSSTSQNHTSVPPRQIPLYSSFVAASSSGVSSVSTVATGSTGLASGPTSLAGGPNSLGSGSTSSLSTFTGSMDTSPASLLGSQGGREGSPQLNNNNAGSERRKKDKRKKRKKERQLEPGVTDSQPAAMEVVPVKVEQPPGAGGELEVKEEPLDVVQVLEQAEGQSEGERKSEGASSTATTDFTRQFPPITSCEQRQRYKQVFNDEYVEYLKLKNCVDAVSLECTALSDLMRSVPESSEEAREVRRKIREKYAEMQQDTVYQDQKRHYENLHYKLSHIKQVVVDYDNAQIQ